MPCWQSAFRVTRSINCQPAVHWCKGKHNKMKPAPSQHVQDHSVSPSHCAALLYISVLPAGPLYLSSLSTKSISKGNCLHNTSSPTYASLNAVCEAGHMLLCFGRHSMGNVAASKLGGRGTLVCGVHRDHQKNRCGRPEGLNRRSGAPAEKSKARFRKLRHVARTASKIWQRLRSRPHPQLTHAAAYTSSGTSTAASTAPRSM